MKDKLRWAKIGAGVFVVILIMYIASTMTISDNLPSGTITAKEGNGMLKPSEVHFFRKVMIIEIIGGIEIDFPQENLCLLFDQEKKVSFAVNPKGVIPDAIYLRTESNSRRGCEKCLNKVFQAGEWEISVGEILGKRLFGDQDQEGYMTRD